MNYIHQNLAQGRWQKMKISEQIASIGSEYGRSCNWKKKNNHQLFLRSTDRMLELFDLSLSDSRWRGGKLRELARLREMVCRELFDAGDDIDSGSWTDYFNRFGELVNKRNK